MAQPDEVEVDLSPEWTCFPHDAPIEHRTRAWCLQMALFAGKTGEAVKNAGQYERFVTGAVREA